MWQHLALYLRSCLFSLIFLVDLIDRNRKNLAFDKCRLFISATTNEDVLYQLLFEILPLFDRATFIENSNRHRLASSLFWNIVSVSWYLRRKFESQWVSQCLNLFAKYYCLHKLVASCVSHVDWQQHSLCSYRMKIYLMTVLFTLLRHVFTYA